MFNNTKYLLFYRWLCVNLVGFSLLFLAWVNGWIGLAISADPTHIILLIAGIFLYGLMLCGFKIWKTSKELNYIKGDEFNKSSRLQNYMNLKKEHKHSDPNSLIEALKIRLFGKITFVRYLANSLVLFGLVGTVVGFIIAFSGVDPSIVSDINAIAPMVTTLIQGMSVALYTTLAGAIFNIWLNFNYHILADGTAKLVTAILESKADV